MQSKCCSQISACSANDLCNTYVKCQSKCGQLDKLCADTCGLSTFGADWGKGPASIAEYLLVLPIGACGLTNCDACTDVTCAGTAWPAPATAHSITINYTFLNFAGGAPYAGVTVKVCAQNDEGRHEHRLVRHGRHRREPRPG
jgi:hypothetical protein